MHQTDPYDDDRDDYVNEITAKQVLNYIRIYFERYPVVYVNAYAVSRYHAHHAEGGIWLDRGEPLASVPMRKGKNDIEGMKKHLQDILGPDYEGNRNRYSMGAGNQQNLEIMIEDHMAESYPSESFIYE